MSTSWQTVVDPNVWQRITADIETLLNHRSDCAAKIVALKADGCINGNIVEEYRDGGKYGPYYRLTFYTDPATGQKPAPEYLKREDLERVRRQIVNHQALVELEATVNRIDHVLDVVRRYIREISYYLENQKAVIHHQPALLEC